MHSVFWTLLQKKQFASLSSGGVFKSLILCHFFFLFFQSNYQRGCTSGVENKPPIWGFTAAEFPTPSSPEPCTAHSFLQEKSSETSIRLLSRYLEQGWKHINHEGVNWKKKKRHHIHESETNRTKHNHDSHHWVHVPLKYKQIQQSEISISGYHSQIIYKIDIKQLKLENYTFHYI